jgi:hypothetical protein
VFRRVLVVAGLIVGIAGVARAQIPGFPGSRPSTPNPQVPRRDTVPDSTKFKFPPPDTLTARLLSKPGYIVTRYVADTAYFDAERKSIDLLAAKKRLAVVERDSQMVVSDSGIYYTQASRRVVTGGNYVLTPPASSGQAEIRGFGLVNYNLADRSARINNAHLPVNNGDVWYLTVKRAVVQLDTVAGKESPAWIGGGTMTSCPDSVPDFTFEYDEAKRAGSNTLVARNVLMRVEGVPVLWLPFIFTDTRTGRRSGILPPQFGLGDIVRNSPSYRRNVEHVGYYWAPSNYYDFATWLDWRSSAGSTDTDPGWVRFNVDWNYKWLERFLGGRIGASQTQQNNGLSNTAISWSHQQELGRNQHINTNFNYVSSTQLQRQNTFNPYSALATISSQATYQAKMGPASLSIGATQKQYPGRDQLDRTLPTVSFSTTALSIGDAFSWTPGFSFSRSDVLHMDQPGIGQFAFSVDPVTGKRDSVLSKNRGSNNVTMSFDSPFQIFGWNLGNSFRLNQQRNNFPQLFTIYDVKTGLQTGQRIYSATYRSDFDWTPTFTLPWPFGTNRFNLMPTLSLANVDPGPMWVASERTNGKYVSQSKRVSVGVSASPTVYAFFPGFGPFQRIRHSVTPQISYSYAPEGRVSDEYLQALGRTRQGYLGALQQQQVSFGLNQNFEAKIGDPNDTLTAAKKIRLLTINASAFTYDFMRASDARAHGRMSKWAGLTTENFTYSLNSELLPGFDFSSSYSLFQGSTLSDTAKFAPYLTGITASFSVGRDQNPFVAFARLFGRAEPPNRVAPNAGTDQVRPRPDDNYAQALAAQPVAGSARGGDRFVLTPTQGWQARFSLSRSSPRPPVGGDVIDYDPRQRCAAQVGTDPFLLDACIANQRAQPTTDTPVTSATAGAQAYRIPPTTSVNSDVSFNLTPKWAAHWTTTYDVEHHEFASHIVNLQRDLHDWRAIFGFTQSPNGNFAFNFMIALKAEPDIKFDYNKATVRSGAQF